MLNIVVPMAGRGSRFADAGYTLPKPLIPVAGQPMIGRVIDNLRPEEPHRFIFITRDELIEQHGVDQVLRSYAPNCVIRTVHEVTQGAACTVLLVRDLIDNDQSLMIANCDQYVDADIDTYLEHMRRNALDGLIMTMTADDPKWSYARFDDHGRIVEVVEKQVVSQEATVGIYNYARGADFVRAAEEMIRQDLRVNGEFYVAPAYNQMIAHGARLGVYNIGAELDGMYGLGIPADLVAFERTDVFQRLNRAA